MVVYRRAAEDLLVCVNASNRAKDFQWVMDHVTKGVAVDEGDEYAQLALQGPRAVDIVAKLGPLRSGFAPGLYRFREETVAGRRVLLARTGYTGEDGFELFCKPGDAAALWDALLEAGRAEGLIPCGLGARDSLRTEMKYCLYGNDIDDSTSPLEAGLGWITKLDKAGGFVGAEAPAGAEGARTDPLAGRLRADRARHPAARLSGVRGRRGCRPGHERLPLADARQAHRHGHLRPAGQRGARWSPWRSRSAALRRLPAVVVETPFYKPATKR